MNFIKKFTEYTQFVETPDKFKIWSAISIVAAALERKVWTDFESNCYPNLYMMFVGPPAAGKSLSAGMAYEIISKIKNIRFASTSATSAAFIKHLEDTAVVKKFSWNGKEYHHSAVYMYSSEAVSTLKNYEGTLIWLLNDFYDSGPTKGWSNEVSWKKSTVGSGDQKLYNLCVNMLGCCTPDLLESTIVDQNFKSGFGSRCLFIVSSSVKKIIPWREKRNMNFMEPELLQDLQRIHQMSGPISVTDEYKDLYDEVKQRGKDDVVKNANNFLGSYYGRKAWNMRKLSTVLYASQGLKGPMQADLLRLAETLLKDVEESLGNAFGHADKSVEFQNCMDIWETLRHRVPEYYTGSQLSKIFMQYDTKDLLTALKRLKEIGKIEITIGRPVTYTLVDREPISTLQ